jgi:hypothetical protein
VEEWGAKKNKKSCCSRKTSASVQKPRKKRKGCSRPSYCKPKTRRQALRQYNFPTEGLSEEELNSANVDFWQLARHWVIDPAPVVGGILLTTVELPAAQKNFIKYPRLLIAVLCIVPAVMLLLLLRKLQGHQIAAAKKLRLKRTHEHSHAHFNKQRGATRLLRGNSSHKVSCCYYLIAFNPCLTKQSAAKLAGLHTDHLSATEKRENNLPLMEIFEHIVRDVLLFSLLSIVACGEIENIGPVIAKYAFLKYLLPPLELVAYIATVYISNSKLKRTLAEQYKQQELADEIHNHAHGETTTSTTTLKNSHPFNCSWQRLRHWTIDPLAINCGILLAAREFPDAYSNFKKYPTLFIVVLAAVLIGTGALLLRKLHGHHAAEAKKLRLAHTNKLTLFRLKDSKTTMAQLSQSTLKPKESCCVYIKASNPCMSKGQAAKHAGFNTDHFSSTEAKEKNLPFPEIFEHAFLDLFLSSLLSIVAGGEIDSISEDIPGPTLKIVVAALATITWFTIGYFSSSRLHRAAAEHADNQRVANKLHGHAHNITAEALEGAPQATPTMS